MRLKGLFLIIACVLIGGLLGYFPLAEFFIWKAKVAVKVRPGLAELSWTEALFSDHFWEWFFYNYPTTGRVISAILGVTIGFFVGLFLKKVMD